jgi:hypothetical protein
MTTSQKFDLGTTWTLRGEDRDVNLAFGAWNGKAQMKIWKNNKLLLSETLNELTIQLIKKKLQWLEKDSLPDSKSLFMKKLFDKTSKKYKDTLYTMLFEQTEKQEFFIRFKLHQSGDKISFPIKLSNQIDDPDLLNTDIKKAKFVLETFIEFIDRHLLNLSYLTSFNKDPLPKQSTKKDLPTDEDLDIF